MTFRDLFVRIHRSAIVNLDFVREVRPWSAGEQVLVLAGDREMTIGRAYRRRVAEAISATTPARGSTSPGARGSKSTP